MVVAHGFNDVLDVVDDPAQVRFTKRFPQVTRVAHDPDGAAAIRHSTELLVVQVTPVRVDAIDAGVRNQEGHVAPLGFHRVPKTGAAYVGQVDQDFQFV